MKNRKPILHTTYYTLQANKGFIALIAVLIILAISLTIGLGANLLSINETKMALKKYHSLQAFSLAQLCAEEALMKLKEDENYPGDETFLIEGGSCQILPIEGNWTLKVLSNFQNQTKKIKIVIEKVNPEMVIDSWEQVPDF